MGDDPNQYGNSRRWIIREVEDSLRRLNTDWIDLYQIHRPEPDTDIEETLGALSDLVHAGKVRYIGSSTYPASRIVEAQWAARDRNLERFVCEQPPYSLLARGIEADVLPTARRHGMAVIPWSPLAGGWLSGRWRKGDDTPVSPRAELVPRRYDLSLPENQRKLEVADALARLADEAGLSLIHMALAFVIRHPAITAAIIGPRTMEHLESQLGAADVVLDDALLDRIDELVTPGTNLNPADAGWTNPDLEPAAAPIVRTSGVRGARGTADGCAGLLVMRRPRLGQPESAGARPRTAPHGASRRRAPPRGAPSAPAASSGSWSACATETSARMSPAGTRRGLSGASPARLPPWPHGGGGRALGSPPGGQQREAAAHAVAGDAYRTAGDVVARGEEVDVGARVALDGVGRERLHAPRGTPKSLVPSAASWSR